MSAQRMFRFRIEKFRIATKRDEKDIKSCDSSALSSPGLHRNIVWVAKCSLVHSAKHK